MIGSWVIVNRETDVAVIEIFSHAIVKKVNKAKYRAIPIMEYLTALNAKIKKESQ